MENLTKLLNLIKLTNDFKKIERDIPQLIGFQHENDAEHSYQLAMVSWYLATTEGNNFNIEKIFKYSLVHDLPEVYAGDTPLHTSINDNLKSKKIRETDANLRLMENFPNFPDLCLWIKKYEERTDAESKLVYAVDKLLPIMAIYLDNGHAWKTHKIDIDSLVQKNKERIAISSIVEKYFNLILEAIRNEIKLLDKNTTFVKALTHDGERCDVHHIDTDNFDEIPDELKLKAHAVCIYNGKMLLVNHPEWDIWSIPGGSREEKENIEETLKREILEETNCEVVDFHPIACHKVISPDGNKFHYRLHYLCNVTPLGNFEKDPAGNINKIEWIEPNKFEDYIENKEFKKLVIRRAFDVLKEIYGDKKDSKLSMKCIKNVNS